MPPKPRPKPRAKIATPSSPATATVPLDISPTNTSQAATLAIIQDEDELFFKNRSRTAETWRQITRKAEEADTRKHRLSDTVSDTETENGSSPHRRKQKKVAKSRGVSGSKPGPSWIQRASSILEISSDEDDDILSRLDSPKKRGEGQSQRRGQGRAQAEKQSARSRSSSLSITPPPELPECQLQFARETVRRMIGIPKQDTLMLNPEPYEEADESTDSITLNPELAEIAREAKLEVQRSVSVAPLIQSRSPSPSQSTNGIDSADTLIITVRWIEHPLKSAPQEMKKWGFKMKRGDSFKVLFVSVADLAGIFEESLVVRYEGKKVYPSTSPRGVGIWGNAELEAGDKLTFDYLRDNPQSLEVTPALSTSNISAAVRLQVTNDFGAADSDDDGEDDTFKLVVRSSVTADKDITLTVRPTTKCGAIVKAFLKRAGLANKYSDPIQPAPAAAAKGKGKGRKTASATPPVTQVPVLVVDGDKISADTPIGDMDLEDGDLVEVVGL